MVASTTSIIFAAVALGAASTYATSTAFNGNLVRRAPEESTLAAAAAASASNSTASGASDIAVTAVSSTSHKAKPHHHHRHHHHHEDEEIFEAGFDKGFEAGIKAALRAGNKHHHGHHGEKSAEASARVNETITVQTQADIQPTHLKRSFNSILRRGRGDGMPDGPNDPSMMMSSPGLGENGSHENKGRRRRKKSRKPRCTQPNERYCRPPSESHRGPRHRGPKGPKQSPMGSAELNMADASQAQNMPPPIPGTEDGALGGAADLNANAPPMKRNWKRDLAHGLGLEDEFFMKRAYGEDEFVY